MSDSQDLFAYTVLVGTRIAFVVAKTDAEAIERAAALFKLVSTTGIVSRRAVAGDLDFLNEADGNRRSLNRWERIAQRQVVASEESAA